MTKKPKKSRFMPEPRKVPLTDKVEARSDAQIRAIVQTRGANALRWLKKQGWRLENTITEGGDVRFVRRLKWKAEDGENLRFFEYLEGPGEGIDSRDAASYSVYVYSQFTRLAMERGDYEKAIGWAWWTGFYSGRSNAMHLEARAAAEKKKGKAKVSDAVYRDAIKRAGKNATIKTIIAALPREAFEKGKQRTHYVRIKSLQNH